MSVCVHREFRGTKDCPRCYPKDSNVFESTLLDGLDVSCRERFDKFLRWNKIDFDFATKKKLLRFFLDEYRRGYSKGWMANKKKVLNMK